MTDVREIVAQRLLEELERQSDDPSRGFTGYVRADNGLQDVCVDIQSVDLVELARIALVAALAVQVAADIEKQLPVTPSKPDAT